jgi:hypothetical protein
MKNSILLFTGFCLIALGAINQIPGSEINKTFAKKGFVQLKTILGSCKVIKSEDDKIRINLTYSFKDDEYKTSFSESGDSLFLEEEFSAKSPKGYSLWVISFPGDTKMDFSSGTGNFDLEGVSSELKVQTGTGLIEVKNSTGKYDLSTGTGNANITDISITGSSKIRSGTGNVNLVLSTTCQYDLSIISGMGSAILNYNGNPLKGCFDFTVKKESGRIVSPIKFTNEETVSDEHFKYDKKSFCMDSKNMPLIHIEGGLGIAKLAK